MVDRLDSSTDTIVSAAPHNTSPEAARRANSCQKISTTPAMPASPPSATRADIGVPRNTARQHQPEQRRGRVAHRHHAAGHEALGLVDADVAGVEARQALRDHQRLHARREAQRDAARAAEREQHGGGEAEAQRHAHAGARTSIWAVMANHVVPQIRMQMA